MKKRLACAMILFTIVFSLVPTALAADTVTYDLSPLDISVELPADWAVVTQTNCDEAICQEYFFASAEEMKADLSEYDVYLDSVDKNNTNCRIYIYITERSDTDYNELSEAELNAEAETYMELYTDDTFTGYSIYENGNITYLTYDYYNSDAYCKDYVTLHDGYKIYFTALSYNGTVSEDFAQIVKEAVDSAVFTADVAAAKAVALEAKIIVAVAILVLTGVVYLLLKSRGKRKAKVLNGYTAAAQNTYYNPQPFQPQSASIQPVQAQSPPAEHPSSQPIPVQSAAPQQAPAQAVLPNQNINSIRLKQLKELFDSGIITQEEYDAKKAEILKNF